MKTVSALAKALASDKLRVRKRAQLDVSMLLCKGWSKNDAPSYTEMLAICKGLYYSLWMQDKLLLKEEVVHRMCSTLPLIPNPVIRHYYFNGVFETLAREWDKLDSWRIDKFMMLARDFFVQGLRSFPAVDSKLWNSFLDSVFEKILNTNVQQAVGLKLHMCNVLGEELSRKKVKNRCIVSTLTRLVCCLAKLPRHHSYPHSLLYLTHRLLGILRKRPKPMTGHLLAILDNFATQRVTHRKSLKRISASIRAIANKKTTEVTSTANHFGLGVSCSDEPSCPVSPIPAVTNDSPIAAPLFRGVGNKNKMSTKPTGSNNKRRRFAKTIELAPNDLQSGSIGSIPITSPELSLPIPTLPSQSSLSVFPSDQLAEAESTAELQQPMEVASVQTTFVPCESSSTSSVLPKNVTTPSQRRVSFGKIFRKSFISSQLLPITPTSKVIPAKGILRDHNQEAPRSRMSI